MRTFRIIAIMAGVGFTLGLFSMIISGAAQEDDFRARIPAMDVQVQNFVNATDQNSIDYYRKICLDFIAEIESKSVNSKTIAWAEKNAELIKQTDWDRSDAGKEAKRQKEEVAKAKAKKEAKRKNSLSYKQSIVRNNLKLGGLWEQQIREYWISALKNIGCSRYSMTEKIQVWTYNEKVKFRVNFKYKDNYGVRRGASALYESDYDGNFKLIEVVELY